MGERRERQRIQAGSRERSPAALGSSRCTKPSRSPSCWRRLGELGLEIEHFSAQDKPLFEVVEGDGEKAKRHPVFSVPEILDTVLEIGRRGMQMQRFKGLGEMNAKELFNTTMDPENRKLLRVRLDDDNVVEADRMFDILMGDVVEPRRRFIEDNALNVRNLDV